MSDERPPAATRPFTGRTAWARSLQTPLRTFVRTETGSAVVLLAMVLAALVWVNADASSYDGVWHTQLSVRLGGTGVSQDLRGWMNSGLMTFFFFVIGLEARREFDLGELRDRRRLALPVAAGIGGLVVPVALYLAANAGRPSAHGWGTAMSTDTAFALGMLALAGPRFPERVRAFLLTVAVVDDIVSLVVIGVVYSRDVRPAALMAAAGIFGVILLVRGARVRYGLLYALLGIAAWVAVFKSGVDPVVVGLAMGLLTYAYPAARTDLEHATDLFRSFREQPTPELARSASAGLTAAISPNDRLQQLYHPWTSYLIVPLFALANAGIPISGGFLARGFTSPVTLGIFFGYLAGKPIGVTAAGWLVTRLSRGRLRPPVGWASVVGVGTIAGIGFTVSILIATLAFSGTQLQEAKLGVLSAALGASLAAWLGFRATTLLPPRLQIRALLGTSEPVTDLGVPVDSDRDHIRGPARALVTVVGYGDVRYVWRHLPLTDVHPNAQLAAEAAEAAADQDAFWQMHDLLLDRQSALAPKNLIGYAEELGLDAGQFRDHLRSRAGAARIAEDVDSADLSGVSGTPTFFINERRHYGAYDLSALTAAVRAAKARAITSQAPKPPATSPEVS